MRRYEHLRKKAIEMRKHGKALGEICKMLSMGKGTVFYWIKNIPINRTRLQGDAQRRGTMGIIKKYEKLRAKAYSDGMAEYDMLIKQPSFRDFVMLYLTEGYRKTRHSVEVANSNPNLVKLAFSWMRKLKNKNRLMNLRLQCHVDNDENELKRFWANVLNIENSQIKISRKSNSGALNGRKWRNARGVFSVRVDDTYLRSRIEAWMTKIQCEWEQSVV